MNNSKLKGVPIVVVGVDGSAGSAEALRWAVAEAQLRKAALRIVHAWSYGYNGIPLGGFGAMGGFDSYSSLDLEYADLQRSAEELLERAIGEVVDEVEGVEIQRHVVEGGAAKVLLDAAVGADLLVVGSRGHGGFVGLMLGSVSQQCVSHAPCPVVVVHTPKPTPDDDDLTRAVRKRALARTEFDARKRR